jgi:hypothetical protein
MELPDSSIIAIGRRMVPNNVKIMGLMVKTDKNGDSLWVNTYEHDPNGQYNQNYLWDVVPMDDGGFLAVGEVIGVPPSVPYRQDTWVIRVDSNGCILSICTVSVPKLQEATAFKLYPNPTTGNVNIVADKMISSVEVYNQTGQLVQELTPNVKNAS